MTREFKPLTEWNPRKGDVFENSISRIFADTDTTARMEAWGGDVPSEPFSWFNADYTLVSRAAQPTATVSDVTLRDEIAIKVLPFLLASDSIAGFAKAKQRDLPEVAAEIAYKTADAMLAARKGGAA